MKNEKELSAKKLLLLAQLSAVSGCVNEFSSFIHQYAELVNTSNEATALFEEVSDYLLQDIEDGFYCIQIHSMLIRANRDNATALLTGALQLIDYILEA